MFKYTKRLIAEIHFWCQERVIASHITMYESFYFMIQGNFRCLRLKLP